MNSPRFEIAVQYVLQLKLNYSFTDGIYEAVALSFSLPFDVVTALFVVINMTDWLPRNICDSGVDWAEIELALKVLFLV